MIFRLWLACVITSIFLGNAHSITTAKALASWVAGSQAALTFIDNPSID